ncbi:DUF4384 domain-containing protein, partial [Candidatus Desantisbacteria bacterium]|nr:DUF4384 domain-containing protein [Candidatus Desantisbacteria bacterium]
KSKVESKITSKVDMNISGIMIKEKWFDKNKKVFYSLAVLDRNIACEKLKQQIDNEINVITELCTKAEEYKKNKKLVNALSNYKTAYIKRENLDPVIHRYNVLNSEIDKAGDKLHLLSLSEIKNKIDEISSGIGIAAVDGDNLTVGKQFSMDEGLVNLSEQIISKIFEKGVIKIAVFDFVEANSGKRLKLSNIIESELRTILGKAEDIVIVDSDNSQIQDLKEKAKSLNAQMYLTGLYWVNNNSLKINAKLVDIDSGTLIATGRVNIENNNFKAGDFEAIEKAEKSNLTYDFAVDKMYFAKREEKTSDLNIKVWTDKKEYKIGDPLTIYFKSNKNCYVTLFDIGTSGKINILFPNSFYKDNVINADVTYSIPGDFLGFKIELLGPAGIERIKIAATIDKFAFKSIDSGENILKELNALSSKNWVEDNVEIRIFENEEAQKTRTTRGFSKKIKQDKPESPIDIIGTPGVKP